MNKKQWGMIVGLVIVLALITGGVIWILPKTVSPERTTTGEIGTEITGGEVIATKESGEADPTAEDSGNITVAKDSGENDSAASVNAVEERASAVSENITETGEASASENGLAENGAVSGNTAFSENVTVETVSENAAGDKAASENTASAVSENTASAVSENTASAVSENTAAQRESSPSDLKDTRAPWILEVNNAPQVKVGDVFDVHKYIGYGDDVDRSVELAIEGEVDTTQEGEYPLVLTLKDDAGHTTTQKMNVQVVAELPSSSGSHRTEAFSDFISRYKTEDTLVGIDISRWQGDVDFERVKAAGCEFVYMRIGGLDDGELYTDRYYRYNIEAAKAAGLKIGIYWHAEESTPEEVKVSVAYLMDVLEGEEIDYPIAYDWEDFRHFEDYGMNFKDLNDHLDIFVEEIGKRGYPACLYNSKYYLETIWTNEANHPIWLANYTSATAYKGDYFMWQHSNTGRIDGIEGDVDLDVMYLEKPGEEEPEEL